MEFDISQFGFSMGEAKYRPYEISGKSVEVRMNVFVNQLITDIINDSDMNQSKKIMSLDYINRKQILLSKKANNGAGIAYNIQVDFKRAVREKLLLLTFKKTNSGPNDYQRKGAIK